MRRTFAKSPQQADRPAARPSERPEVQSSGHTSLWRARQPSNQCWPAGRPLESPALGQPDGAKCKCKCRYHCCLCRWLCMACRRRRRRSARCLLERRVGDSCRLAGAPSVVRVQTGNVAIGHRLYSSASSELVKRSLGRSVCWSTTTMKATDENWHQMGARRPVAGQSVVRRFSLAH